MAKSLKGMNVSIGTESDCSSASLVDALHINSNYSKVLTGLNPYLVCYVFSLEVPISCVIEEDEGPKL